MVTESPVLESQISQLDRATVDIQPTLAAAAGPFSLAKVHLGKTALGITPATTYSELAAQEADYGGYVAQAVTWDVPSLSADNTVEVVAGTLTFRPTGPTPDNSIYNVWLSDGGSTLWYFAGALVGGPFPMGTALNSMEITVRYRPASQSIVVTIA